MAKYDCKSQVIDQQNLAAPQQESNMNSVYYCFCVSILWPRMRRHVAALAWFSVEANPLNNTVITQWMLESPGNLKFPLQQTSESLEKWEESGFAWWRTHISGDQANSTQKGRRTQAFKLRSERTNRGAIVLPFCTGNDILSLSKTLKQSCLQTVWLPSSPNPLCHASFEQKLVSKGTAETANLDVGEQKM